MRFFNPLSRVKPHEWLPDQGWQDVLALANILPAQFASLPDEIEDRGKEWKEWFDQDSPEMCPIPGNYKELEPFHQLCLLR